MSAYEMKNLKYQSGFNNFFQSEVSEGVLPRGMNNPKVHPQGLFAEQLSGSAFTRQGTDNKRSWLYRKKPSVSQSNFKEVNFTNLDFCKDTPRPHQYRWNPLDIENKKCSFLQGLYPHVSNGDPSRFKGSQVYLYSFDTSESNECLTSHDGDFLFVPYSGKISLITEFGVLEIEPLEIAVIPRGVKFSVYSENSVSSGYLLENFGAPFELPSRGPIGANGLANERDFQAPVAMVEESSEPFKCITKFQNKFYESTLGTTPYDVMGWHGNYYPYKYDLRKFNTINTVSFDHPDPSIFTVLTSPSHTPGVANLDFVIFPPRWMVAENTFRPPYYHRNIMSEFMGLIEGQYDAKPGKDFAIGGSSLHNCMSPHGPSKVAYDAGVKASEEPKRYENNMAFMFESCFPFGINTANSKKIRLQDNYSSCWDGL